MFKKLSKMEKAMCSILNSINNSNNCHHIFNNFDKDSANAFHECFKCEYVDNVDEFTDANGNYHFASLGNTHINTKGLKFIRDMSLGFRIKNAVFDVLKGTLGFLLGILSTVFAEIIILWITHPELLSRFLP